MAEVKCYADCRHRVKFSCTCELDEVSITETLTAEGFMPMCENAVSSRLHYEEKQDEDSLTIQT